MENIKQQLSATDEHDAIDSYFECVTACSLDDEEEIACVTRCVEVHLKDQN